MKNFWEYIILCFTHTYVGEFFSLEDSINKQQAEIKKQFKDILENYYEKKKLNKINPEIINFLFINTCSGKNYEKIKNNANFKQIVNKNNDYKDKVINIIKSFEKKDPMYYAITTEEKNELCYRKIENTYIIYEINYENKVYKDFTGKPIFSKLSKINKKEEKYKFSENFFYKHKRALGFSAGGLLGGVFIAGLLIPGVNALEIGWLGSFVAGVIVEGGTGFFVLKRGMKNTLEKIKDKEIKQIEEFENK